MAFAKYLSSKRLLSCTSSSLSNYIAVSFRSFSNVDFESLQGSYLGSTIVSSDGKKIREGFGTFRCNEWIYSGDWKDDRPHGFGKCIKNELEEYKGEWKDGKRHGWGKLRTRQTYNEPWRVYGYNGQFEDDLKHGVGYTALNNPPYIEKTFWHKGIKVQESKFNDVSSIKEIVVNESFDKDYTGDTLMNGIPQGQGTKVFEDGSKYVGEWYMGQRHGWGELTNLFGETYRGQWHGDMRNGHGEASFCTGNSYVGEWKNDKFHGKGRYVSSGTGSILEGTWLDNLMCGHGTEITTKGVYEGNFLDSVWCGPGKFTDNSGIVSIGLWIDRKMNGFGSKYDAHDHLIEEGIFVDDKLQRDVK